ncbi:DUF421 domain-containing protein [Pseudaminobacter sp. 19-2017]|uniref:DUF421 domain-containing protein n=1 Tax=Pseudaminobacter soli (ex Zhang et al. 2022) TaxID=2831468 RepID=A0A942E3L7_9HYPH|nr:YetF domain-containing protein [Pseudaminobacter soli]MBS3652513.1 DUF421 domain-containing protein [Pseudaminobacter soli]
MELVPTDWLKVFAPETPILELIARACVLYLGILAFLRVLLRRTGGEVAHMDLIFMLLIAEAAAHSMGDYHSVGDGLIVIITFMALNYSVNAFSFYLPSLEKLVESGPLEVVRDGKPLPDNMRREFLTEQELMSCLRQNGMDDLSTIKVAVIEAKGKISFVPFKT